MSRRTPTRAGLTLAVWLAACGGPGPARDAAPSPAAPVRLVDLFDRAALSEAREPAIARVPTSEWSFTAPGADAAGWQAGRDVADLAVRDGALRGRSTGPVALLHVAIETERAADDPVHAIEIRGSVSAGESLAVRFGAEAPEPGLAAVSRGAGTPGWGTLVPIEAGEAFQTWRLPPPAFGRARARDARHLFVRRSATGTCPSSSSSTGRRIPATG